MCCAADGAVVNGLEHEEPVDEMSSAAAIHTDER
jgi:hypothetical protein